VYGVGFMVLGPTVPIPSPPCRIYGQHVPRGVWPPVGFEA